MRALRAELDEAKRKVSRLSQEAREVNSCLEASEREKETLKETIGQLEDSKRQQERALEKLNKEVSDSFHPFESAVGSSCSSEELELQNTNTTLILFCPALSCQHEALSGSSREEVQALRVQMEEHRERARKEIQEAQRHGNDAQSELDQSHTNLRRLEEEVCVCFESVHDYASA